MSFLNIFNQFPGLGKCLMKFGKIEINKKGNANPKPRSRNTDIDWIILSYKSAADNAIPENGPAHEEDVIAASIPLKKQVKYVFFEVYLTFPRRGK